MDPATIKMIISGLLAVNKSRKNDVNNELDSIRNQPMNIVKRPKRGVW